MGSQGFIIQIRAFWNFGALTSMAVDRCELQTGTDVKGLQMRIQVHSPQSNVSMLGTEGQMQPSGYAVQQHVGADR